MSMLTVKAQADNLAFCEPDMIFASEEQAKALLQEYPSSKPFDDEFRYYWHGQKSDAQAEQLRVFHLIKNTKAFHRFVNGNPRNAFFGIYQGIKSRNQLDIEIAKLILDAADFDINRTADGSDSTYKLIQFAFQARNPIMALALISHRNFFKTNKIPLSQIAKAAEEKHWSDVSALVLKHERASAVSY